MSSIVNVATALRVQRQNVTYQINEAIRSSTKMPIEVVLPSASIDSFLLDDLVTSGWASECVPLSNILVKLILKPMGT